ncbi:MAG: hypothetical protein A6F72_04605 [Cycloclasticus sp. symbiont of Poecilosclerida sp. N]|nr:MAG: hypothetical protein A6F72_04605 [Cycloclasticus sp. symbiont of Poecilosclerida sp. N]
MINLEKRMINYRLMAGKRMLIDGIKNNLNRRLLLCGELVLINYLASCASENARVVRGLAGDTTVLSN